MPAHCCFESCVYNWEHSNCNALAFFCCFLTVPPTDSRNHSSCSCAPDIYLPTFPTSNVWDFRIPKISDNFRTLPKMIWRLRTLLNIPDDVPMISDFLCHVNICRIFTWHKFPKSFRQLPDIAEYSQWCPNDFWFLISCVMWIFTTQISDNFWTLPKMIWRLRTLLNIPDDVPMISDFWFLVSWIFAEYSHDTNFQKISDNFRTLPKMIWRLRTLLNIPDDAPMISEVAEYFKAWNLSATF